MVTLRVPAADAAEFWARVPKGEQGMGRLPAAMLRGALVGAAVGLFLGLFGDGFASAAGLMAAGAAVCAFVPVVPEIDLLRAAVGAAGERLDVRRSHHGLLLLADWQSVPVHVRRVQSRIHIVAGVARLSVPAAAFGDAGELGRLLESA
ncbi:MAG TPA: hypothetical protein VGC20_11745 [bacterium]